MMISRLRKTGRLAALVLCSVGVVGLSGTAMAQGPGAGCPAKLVRNLPVSNSASVTGKAFSAEVANLSGPQRDAVAETALLAGNIPNFLRHLIPIKLQGRSGNDKLTDIVVCVMPDYLSVGSDNDFVRIPLGLPAAIFVAKHLGFMLPTTKIVDEVYAQADVHLRPEPLEPGPEMRSTGYFSHHNDLVDQEILADGAKLGMLLAGQKKDLVLTNRLRQNPGRVAIYGWHRLDGKPIQPLSTVHGKNYADYSHGVRLVSAVAYVDGAERPLPDVLQDPQLAPIVSSEGPIPDPGALGAP